MPYATDVLREWCVYAFDAMRGRDVLCAGLTRYVCDLLNVTRYVCDVL